MISPLLIMVIVIALVFAFVTGFHDTANAIATSVYTRALTPGKAIALASVMNFIGALVSERVAMTICKGLVVTEPAQFVILAALLGAVFWNLLTWYYGIPCSSSHALIGSLLGAVIVSAGGFQAVLWGGVTNKVIIPLFTSPLIGLVIGYIFMKLLFFLLQNETHRWVNQSFSKLQVLSAALVAYSHGNNDAQKTMGIITLALIASDMANPANGVPMWVKIVCAVMMALGTASGGRRIMKTMGSGVTRLEPVGGFAAQTASAIVIEASTVFGIPVSTTQVITSAVMGVGSAKRLSAVKWSAAANIVLTWFITLPVTIVIGGLLAYLLEMIF